MRKRVRLAAVALVLTPVAAQVAFALLPGFASYAVASGSMEPTVDRGSVVYVRATDEYATGDVLTYVRGGRVVTHRVVETTPEGYVTKGDANDEPDDGLVERNRVVGEVIASVPLYGYPVAFAQSGVGRVALVGVPAAALLVVEIRRLRRIW
ncbi:signal peptidase I [Halorussus sp. AFM4]|uniref:signal peptidase I n=1 Tax=Halorussus sp. AFM4 TaxID=3421651 RepID=UPI003EB76141